MIIKVNIALLIVLALANLTLTLTGCNGDDGPNGPDGDKTPPTVISTLPPDEATDVTPDTEITARFSELIDTGTIDQSSFVVSPAVSGTFSFADSQVTLTPASVLMYDTTYTVTITTAVTDQAGNHLAEDFSWPFTIEPDPATTLPVIVATNPANQAVDVAADAPVTATFSKEIDDATLTAASFYLDKGVTGTVTYADKLATLLPDSPLDYSTYYTATITAAVQDTFGNALQGDYTWGFTTQADPMIPVASLFWPPDSAIVGDTVTVLVATSHPVGVQRVEFYVDWVHVTGADDTEEPFTFAWDLSGEDIASRHYVYAKAYDSEGHEGISDTASVLYGWQLAAIDGFTEDIPQDIRRMLVRSCDSILELRYEFSANWRDPYHDTLIDSVMDLGIYFDADQNPSTGFRQLQDGTLINDIGAEYLSIVGFHAASGSFYRWSGSDWITLWDTTGFAVHNVPMDTNVLEIGVRWRDLDYTSAVDIVSFYAYFKDTNTVIRDFVPNQGQGHITVPRENRYVGGWEGSSAFEPPLPARRAHVAGARPTRNNPFD